ncbi:hypothetical protein LUW75_23365 [Streptomyces sp. MRC013]|uniref:hypothetical protein n=1 Tax=Streptomyces sp. MRC013 TaxID=2898276 RepID=UPI00202635B4|nr:hypothetical protein [Streptomyces sp. MRC013]URM92408.1 hypothetical protein LUW75_23365 [Streptomyces sp. MRC013]
MSRLDHRRALCPEHEYGDVTPEEWVESEGHFGEREVGHGDCTRPHGSPRQREPACVRRPMPQVDPKTLPGLAEIGRNPVLRRRRAEEEQRLGGIEGAGPTPTSVRTEQAGAARLTRRSPVALGIPAVPPSG